jgi:tRNA(fMet)-specific endonuclease VapC
VRIALDTIRYTDLARGEPGVVEVLRGADRIFVPFVVLSELRAGFRAGTRGAANEAKLTLFLQSPRVETLYADEATVAAYAHLFAALRRRGTPIPTNDLWIAALVMQHELVLATRDTHFGHVVEIARI